MAKQFVIQKHTTPDDVHWDLMLEMNDVLWTWRLFIPPAEIKKEAASAERIHDHPIRFLTYEGPVQNNTGNVTIVDKGKCRIIKQTENTLLFKAQGTILSGTFSLSNPPNAPLETLQRQPSKPRSSRTRMLLILFALIAAIIIFLRTAGPYVFVVNSIPHQTPLTCMSSAKMRQKAL